MSLNHPVYSQRKCHGCGKYMAGVVVPPSVEGAVSVVLYMCENCDRQR